MIRLRTIRWKPNSTPEHRRLAGEVLARRGAMVLAPSFERWVVRWPA